MTALATNDPTISGRWRFQASRRDAGIWVAGFHGLKSMATSGKLLRDCRGSGRGRRKWKRFAKASADKPAIQSIANPPSPRLWRTGWRYLFGAGGFLKFVSHPAGLFVPLYGLIGAGETVIFPGPLHVRSADKKRGPRGPHLGRTSNHQPCRRRPNFNTASAPKPASASAPGSGTALSVICRLSR